MRYFGTSLLVGIGAVLPLMGCGPADFDRAPPCGGIQLRVLDSVAEAPANVAAVLRVSDCDDRPLGVQLDESAFALSEDGQVLSAYEASRMVRPAARRVEGRVLIALDLSGSITRVGLRPLMIDAAKEIVAEVDPEHEIAIFGFDGRPDLVPFTYLTSDRAVVERALDAALAAPLVDDSTNLNGAVIAGLEVLDHAVRIEEQDPSAVAAGTLVIFSDGSDHAGYFSAEQVRDALDATDHSVLAVGVGPTIDDAALASLGRTDYALATDPDLGSFFGGIADRIRARATQDYVVSYCSPARAGSRTLEIELAWEQSIGRTELVFDASGFGAGCSPEASPFK